MSETLDQEQSPEKAVFGDAFSFSKGVGDEATVAGFFGERLSSVREGVKTWLPRTLDADQGVCADLFKDGKVAATLVFDYDDNSASVYATSEGGNFGDTSVCDRVTFAEAVNAAEQSVA